jgi:hypothetical protein
MVCRSPLTRHPGKDYPTIFWPDRCSSEIYVPPQLVLPSWWPHSSSGAQPGTWADVGLLARLPNRETNCCALLLCTRTETSAQTSPALWGRNWCLGTRLTSKWLQLPALAHPMENEKPFYDLRTLRQEENLHTHFWWTPQKWFFLSLRDRDWLQENLGRKIDANGASLKEGQGDKRTHCPHTSLFFHFFFNLVTAQLTRDERGTHFASFPKRK